MTDTHRSAGRTAIHRIWIVCFLAATTAMGQGSGAPNRDNILLIVADDIGLRRVEVFGRGPTTGPTPTLNALSNQGVRFNRAYGNPVCSATRATILTGRYGFRTGIGANIEFAGEDPFELSEGEFTLADALAPTHRTAALGKWHLGHQLGAAFEHPIKAGFDIFAGSKEQLGGLASPPLAYYSWEKNVATVEGAVQFAVEAYSTTDHVDDALMIIQEFGDHPWFVQVAFNAAHTPFHAPPDTLITLDVDEGDDDVLKHRAMVEAMDTEIARLFVGIDEEVMQHTWVIFLADNGTHGHAISDPALVDKAKGTIYESGIGVPLIITGPDVVGGGRNVSALVNTTDIFATVLDMAGVSLPNEQEPEDSTSLMPLLLYPDHAPLRLIAYAELFEPNGFGPRTSLARAAIEDRYKLQELTLPDGSPHLVMFDLALDPAETQDLLEDGIPLPLFGVYLELLTVLFDLARPPG